MRTAAYWGVAEAAFTAAKGDALLALSLVVDLIRAGVLVAGDRGVRLP